ncbi:MAG: hypothetical protein WC868_00395 [Bacteroidales bacterium]
MSEIVIEVNNLSQQYRLGTVGTTSIADDFNGKEMCNKLSYSI